MLAVIPVLRTPTLSFIAIRKGTAVVRKDIQVLEETLTDYVYFAGLIFYDGSTKYIFFSEKPVSDMSREDIDKILELCPQFEGIKTKEEFWIEEVRDVPDIYHLIDGAGITR